MREQKKGQKKSKDPEDLKDLCSVCGAVEPPIMDPYGKWLCYECQAQQEIAMMRRIGRNTMYLERTARPSPSEKMVIRNWTGKLVFRVIRSKETKHNMRSCSTVHVWFDGPDGFVWYGRQVDSGNHTMVRTRRTKVKS